MATLIWCAPMFYGSPRDESAFFTWLQSIPGVLSVRGCGKELHIRLRSRGLSRPSLLEFLALYRRYGGNIQELVPLVTPENLQLFNDPSAYWRSSARGPSQARRAS